MSEQFERFSKTYDELLEAYKASDGADLAYARMVGALKVIVGFNINQEDLDKISAELERSIKNETFKILSS